MNNSSKLRNRYRSSYNMV